MDERRGYSDDRNAARDALLALLGAGVLVAAAPARRRKALGLLAILAVLALFLWRRAQAAVEVSEAEAPQPHAEEAVVEEAAVEEAAVEEAAVEAAAEEAVVEETVVEETVVEETAAAVEETAAEEVTAEEVAAESESEAAAAEVPAEQGSGFEALDAALAALIGELERVEASRLEEARIEEAKRAWREEQAEEAREHEEAAERERVESEALVHAGRRLVHAGGSGSDEGSYLPEGDGEDVDALDDSAAEIEAADAAEELLVEAPNDEFPELSLPEALVEEVTSRPAEADPSPDTTSGGGGLVGMIGRYSHRPAADPPSRPTWPAVSDSPAEPAAPPASEPATDDDWL